MPADSKWKELIDEFRALGGVAENVELRSGAIGRGLFAIDPAKPVKIHIPERLLVDITEIEFKNDKIRFGEAAKVSEGERIFLEHFENEFCWGVGGKPDCERYFEEVDALPVNVREILVEKFSMAGLEKTNKDSDRVQKRYLHSRMIEYDGRQVLMPILGLINHGVDGISFNTEKGVSIGGMFSDEVLAHYSAVDPLGAFISWGFDSKEPLAFSLPLTMDLDSNQLVIKRSFLRHNYRGKFRVPVLEIDGDQITLSYLMLGHARYPRLAKGVFYTFMKDIGEVGAERIFDQIRRVNVQQYLDLMEAMEGHQGVFITMLRRMCRYQIEAIMHAIGARAV